MPAESKAQQRFMGMKYAEAKKGAATGMDMSTKQLRDFAATKTKGLPGHVKPKRKRAASDDLGSAMKVKQPSAAGRY